ncbi:hypothetical protein V5O48_001169 [Marasmius crinis-equi]|uniref:Fungal-type protein kinase domain-containing protein n=1 Tax=Marasmius crinis-equi TaxID=585013 RepID=A0ABR3FZB8_9AGAR
MPSPVTELVQLDDPAAEDRNVSRPFPFDSERLRCNYGLSGRCTQVFQVYHGHASQRRNAVSKLLVPDISHDKEPDLMNEARKMCPEEPKTLVACLPPEMFSHRDFTASRIVRITVSGLYRPIMDLTTNWSLFMSTFWVLVCAHATLWAEGIKHGDINVNNLTYETGSDDPLQVRPKLCDHDLPTSFSNTGLLRFMATDILIGFATGRIVLKKEYWHDCESFSWLLIWILGRYCDGRQIQGPHFEEWGNHNYRDLLYNRAKFYEDQPAGRFEFRNDKVPNRLFDRAFRFLAIFARIRTGLQVKKAERGDAQILENTDEVVKLDRELQHLNSPSDTLSKIMQSLLFADSEYGGRVHGGHLEALKFAVEDCLH